MLLLGVSVSTQTVMALGTGLLGGIAAVVLVAIGASYGIGRLLGLPPRMATLVACGNSICGNSAIAAAAPVIGADSKDISASIAFTAVLGVIVVLGLPLVPVPLHFNGLQYGVLAGLTVYAGAGGDRTAGSGGHTNGHIGQAGACHNAGTDCAGPVPVDT